MIIEVDLQHATQPERTQKIELWGDFAPEISKASARGGNAEINKLVSSIITAKLPQHLYNFKPLDWRFK